MISFLKIVGKGKTRGGEGSRKRVYVIYGYEMKGKGQGRMEEKGEGTQGKVR